jgi:cytochrome b561
MTLRAETRSTAKLAAPHGYDPVMKAVHWSVLLLITVAYIAIWAGHTVATAEQRAVLVQLHRSLGVTIFVLTLFRLGWRWHARIPGLPADIPAIQKVAARATEYLIYVLLLAQPTLGVLHTNARGKSVDFFFLGELPPIVGSDKILARQAIAAHDLVAYVLVAVVALHAAAALFHHFVRRDDVLNAMLPRRR